MVQADFVICTCVLLGRCADEAVVDEQLVVRVGAVRGQDFFADLCGSFSVSIPSWIVLLTYAVVPESELPVISYMGTEQKARK